MPLTIDDYERLPQEEAEGHELVDGELVASSGNTFYGNSIRDLLLVLLLQAVRERSLGVVIAEQEYDFNGNAHAPDVSFFGQSKTALADPDKRVQRLSPTLPLKLSPPTTPSKRSSARRIAIGAAAPKKSGSFPPQRRKYWSIPLAAAASFARTPG